MKIKISGKSLLLLLFPTLFLTTRPVYINAEKGPTTMNPNPAFRHNADATCMKYNGEYYHTLFRRPCVKMSEDMVRWTSNIQIFPDWEKWETEEMGRHRWEGTDLTYVNGTFHYFWRHSKPGILQHSESSSPLGPYTVPSSQKPLLKGGLGPAFYKDIHGKFYWLTTVTGKKLTKYGHNEIWGATMKDPRTINKDNKLLLYTPGKKRTWENIDHYVMENPFIFHYRGSYYMNYTSNAINFGNYAIGITRVDEKAGPLAFRNKNKYPDPLCERVLYVPEEESKKVWEIGQSAFLRGPDGFSWWMFNKGRLGTNQKSPHALIDRVFFFNRMPHTDGPTSPYTDGYHPPPYMPTLLDLFNSQGPLPSHYIKINGQWNVKNGEACQSSPSTIAMALVQSSLSANYLFEINLKIDSKGKGSEAGALAFYKDNDNYVEIMISPNRKKVYRRVKISSRMHEKSFTLPDNFKFNVYHCIRVEKNSGLFRFRLDNEKHSSIQEFGTPFTEAKGRPGLITRNAKACFDGVIYTIGWDEWDNYIRGWGDSFSQIPKTGKWSIDKNGITGQPEKKIAHVFKGEMFDEYEFSVQVTASDNDPKTTIAGIYAIAQDEQNLLTAGIDFKNKNLIIFGKQEGKSIPEKSIPLPERWYIPISRDDPQDWKYTFKKPKKGWEKPGFKDSQWKTGKETHTSWKTPGIWLRKTFRVKYSTHHLPRLYLKWKDDITVYINGILAYKPGPTRYIKTPPKFYETGEITDPARLSIQPGRKNIIAVHCKRTNGPGYIDIGLFLPKIPETGNPPSYNLRVVKRHDKQFIFINNQELYEFSHTWGPSQVGLFTKNRPANFNTITYIKLASQYGTNPPGRLIDGDNFDDNLLSLTWKSKMVHRDNPVYQDFIGQPCISFNENNHRLQIQGSQSGPTDSWNGRAALYNIPIKGNATVSFDFNGLQTQSINSQFRGGAIGLRLHKDKNNWIEIRQTTSFDKSNLELTIAVNGKVKTLSKGRFNDKGNFKLVVKDDSVRCYVNEKQQWAKTVPFLKASKYYAMITAYSRIYNKYTPSFMEVNVDNFQIKK